MLVFDSVYCQLDSATKDIIENLFLPDTIKVVQGMQKQEGGRDCGVFAIATITAIAHGYDPTKMKFDQMAIRNHLHNNTRSRRRRPTTVRMYVTSHLG